MGVVQSLRDGFGSFIQLKGFLQEIDDVILTNKTSKKVSRTSGGAINFSGVASTSLESTTSMSFVSFQFSASNTGIVSVVVLDFAAKKNDMQNWQGNSNIVPVNV